MGQRWQRLRLFLQVMLLAGLVGAWAGNFLHTRVLEASLNRIAENYIDQVKGKEPLEVKSEVVVTKQYLLFGPPSGKVNYYTRLRIGQEPEEFGGLEYHFDFENGHWYLIDRSISIAFESRDAARAMFINEKGLR
ncbi:MAG: hypothetical protein AMXMBFR84_44430 [Candidatus Hydrogenedentota bacterium]